MLTLAWDSMDTLMSIFTQPFNYLATVIHNFTLTIDYYATIDNGVALK